MENLIYMTELQKSYVIGARESSVLGGNISKSYFEIECSNYDYDKVTAAINMIFIKHQLMHSIVYKDDYLKVLDDYEVNIEKEDFRKFKDIELKNKMKDKRNKIFNTLFNIYEEIQVKCYISILSEKHYIIHFYGTGIVFDGWSHEIIINDLNKILNNEEVKEELSFKEYVRIINDVNNINFYEEDAAYFLDKLKGIDYSPELPLKNQVEKVNNSSDLQININLTKEMYNKLTKYSCERNVSTFSVLLTLYGKVLERYSQNSNFIINIPKAKRPLEVEGSLNTVGLCSDFSLFVFESFHEKSLIENIKINQEKIIDMQEHSSCSGNYLLQLLQRENGKQVNIPITFTSTLGINEDNRKNIVKKFVKIHTSQVYIETVVSEINNEIVISMNFVKELFTEEVIHGIADTFYENIIQFINNPYDIEKNKNINICSNDIDVVNELNKTSNDINNEFLVDKFNMIFNNYKDKTAIAFENGSLTYDEVKAYADSFASIIYDKYENKDNIKIGIYLKKGWQQIVCAIGAVLNGIVYMPIDSEMTKDELKHCYDNVGLDCIISEKSLLKSVIDSGINEFIDVQNMFYEKNINNISFNDNLKNTSIIINTSGTTGRPKSIELTQEGISNCLRYSEEIYNISSEDSILAVTNFCHDMSIFDTLGMLWCGGTVVVPTNGKEKDPKHWLKLMNEYNITIWNSVPALLEMLFISNEDSLNDRLKEMKTIILGGDWLSPGFAKDILDKCKNASLYNVGGPTETCIWNIYHKVSYDDVIQGKIPYGRPFSNTKYYILNDYMELCPIGVEGTMYVYGKGVSKGYIGLEEETKKKFVNYKGLRVYNTGDRGKYKHNGDIDMIGRIDNQVKINGKRIELNGIESIISEMEGIISCVVVINTKSKKLAAYYTAAFKIEPKEIEDYLSDKVTSYMIPKEIEYLEEMPLTKNGKINRKELESRDIIDNKLQVKGKNEIENNLINIIKDVLGLEVVNLNDNFFALGGDSVSAMKVVSLIKDKMKVELSVYDILNQPVLSGWSSNIEELRLKNNIKNDNDISKEDIILSFIRKLLNNEEFNIDDNFTENGGNAELAKKVSEFINERFDKDISLFELVVSPYIEDWIEIIEEA